MTTLLIADDQALVRVGLRKILESEPDTIVAGEAGSGPRSARGTPPGRRTDTARARGA
jgi:DNA-binding NarL/FixJ family response regulator